MPGSKEYKRNWYIKNNPIERNLYIDNLPDEEWKIIDRFSGYSVSNMGRVKSNIGHRRYETLMKPIYPEKEPYLKVVLYFNKKRHYKTIHRLVAHAFIPNPDNKKVANHKNGNKHDNRASELEWTTHSENIQHAFDTGLKYGKRGETAWNSSLKNHQAVEIFNSNLSVRQLSINYGVPGSTIRGIKNGDSWNHVTGKIHVKKLKYLSRHEVMTILNLTGSHPSISKKLGVSIYQVWRVKKFGASLLNSGRYK
jgi:hypothetical protein